MSTIGWPLVEIASRLLESDEREAVLGDLAEANESAWPGALGVLGLFLRRQVVVWKDWRPWFAGFGVALPCSYLLVYVSMSVSCTFQRLVLHKAFSGHDAPTGHEGYALLLCHIFLLLAWSWTAGFVVGSVSRKGLWVSAALCASSCFYFVCSIWFDTASRPSVFLFLLPAIVGVHHGLRLGRIALGWALLLAISVTALMISAWSNQALWILNWALIWPVWYLVASARKPERTRRIGSRFAAF
jgi:hypothetical protein